MSLRQRWSAVVFSAALMGGAVAQAQWAGFVDQSDALRTDRFSFTGTNAEAGDSNDNYYDGDFADFDGDGRLDRAAISRYGLLWNAGGGVMVPVADTVQGGSYEFGDKDSIGNDAVCWADVDNDGDPDSIQGGNGEALTLQVNQAARFSIKWKKSGSSAKRIIKTDLERDGDVDLIVAGVFCLTRDCGQPDDFTVWVNDGTGQFTDETVARGLDFRTGLVAGVSSGDLDGDGDFDLLLVSGTRRRVLAMLNNGAGVFTEREVYTIPDALFSYLEGGTALTVGMSHADTTALGDIDGDGDLDLIVGSWAPFGGHPNVFYGLFLNDGAANFTEASATRFNIGSSTAKLYAPEVKLVDLDVDGDLDLVAYVQGGFADLAGNYLQIFLNDGTGTFTLTPGLAPAFTPPVGTINSFDVADYTGDGAPDLWLGSENGRVIALVNTYVGPGGAPGDQPRDFRVVSATASGVRLEWKPPPSASRVRFYRVYRSSTPGLPIRDRVLVKTVARSRHADDLFVAPILPTTTAAQLADPQVTLSSDGTVEVLDPSAAAGVRFYYSVVHVGDETKASDPTPELAATVPGPSSTDSTGPELEIVSPTPQHWQAFPRVVLQYGDAQSGVDPATVRVSFDAALGSPASGGRAANADLGDLAIGKDERHFVAALRSPMQLPVDTLVTMTATVADRAGNTTTRQVSFFVTTQSAQLPTASFTATPASGAAPVEVAFDGAASSDPDGKVVRWEWYFGDGSMAIGPSVRHAYAFGGTFTALLVVRDTQGGVGAATRAVTVSGAPAVCSNGEVRSCYSGPDGTAGVGVCAAGSQNCLSGAWQPCAGESVPGEEVCGDSQDGDCDGTADVSEPECSTPGVDAGTDAGVDGGEPPSGCGCGTPGPLSLVLAMFLAIWTTTRRRG
ncbi:MAG: FG-GAP-like repeat-containing protein [Myxococcota bacterium]|nr:FG-GAP-like repeat-containing protein [Myxococcota bacterium]